MKKAIIIALTAITSVAMANELLWGTSTVLQDQTGSTIATSFGDPLSGAFAQLVYAGADGQIDAFGTSGAGTTGDDMVVAINYAYGTTAAPFAQPGLLGKFNLLTTSGVNSLAENGTYYVRLFNAANSNYGDGTSASVFGTAITYYWDSGVTTFSYDELGADVSWDFASGGSPATGDWTAVAVPEPATIGLLGLGTMAAWFIRRSKQAREEA
ncbi:PEP-CTERM sorting domain-containing protein [Tichowtungia aerotolerans]|uniref:PEP-CTERM sorting domain-containing protein n=1 Tax=Tichowtungia aerotolerans TaxID=2697043 RepID=A0A6P1M1H4_9BACT|nr:PEP-CTERM sorting domain-containing protein [Tichowtungia aerotolerans]QHI67952.1 PEP-CTERM sorting domain-containing protein [Tichowtungia aerotolerans]